MSGNQTRSLRGAFLEGVDVMDDDELRSIIEFPLSADERQSIRDRTRTAADRLEAEAADTWGRLGNTLSTEGRMALVRSIDSARRLRAMADALSKRIANASEDRS